MFKYVGVIVLLFCATAYSLEYPADTLPGKAVSEMSADTLILSNNVIRCQWGIKDNKIVSMTLKHKETGQQFLLSKEELPKIMLSKSRSILLSDLEIKQTNQADTKVVMSDVLPEEGAASLERKVPAKKFMMWLEHPKTKLVFLWSVMLRDDANYVSQYLTIQSKKNQRIQQIVVLDAISKDAVQVGKVDGSVVRVGDMFMAVEHPLAKNTVDNGHVRLAMERGNEITPGKEWTFSTVFGVSPANQFKRGFAYYLSMRRARAYQPFLHYNSWYDLNIDMPDNHMTEEQCLERVEQICNELVTKRGVKVDAMVWDDGWDDFNSLWGFHSDFPDGFKKLNARSLCYGVNQGVWMSPWGGYGKPKSKRIKYGKSKGYETNGGGFSMAGEKYGKAFEDVCLNMMREHGVTYFKFDGMGAGNSTTGASGDSADDIDAVLALTETLRKENPNVYISATVGTWPSPFWTLYADSIWRQGGDCSFYGKGDMRQQWITYRDMHCYRNIVKGCELYPLNALMLHGPCIGPRHVPGKMTVTEKNVADEVWSFFGSGTQLQELYITPPMLTDTMWDELANAAKWSRENSDILVDSQWVGGDPGEGDIYGWAAWQRRKAILTLRNPSEEEKGIILDLARTFNPSNRKTEFVLNPVRTGQRIGKIAGGKITLKLQPFETLVFEGK